MIHIGVVWEIQRRYGEGVIRGICEYALRFGPWHFSFTPMQNFDPQRKCGGLPFSGIIVGCEPAQRLLHVAWPRNIPIVAVHRTADAITPYRVQVDNRAVGWLVGLDFVRRRFRNLGYVPGELDPEVGHWDLDRQEGFCKAAKTAGADVAVYQGAVDDWEVLESEPASEPLIRWIRSLTKPAAILAADDSRARTVMFHAEAAGVRVPEELTIVGVGNEMWTEMLSGGLSSVEVNGFGIGYAAAELLHRVMQGKAGNGQIVRIPPRRLIARHSSNSIAVDDEEVAQAIRFIADHATTGISVRDVADRVPVSRRSLERRFFRALGRTILQEIRAAQIERVKLLLSDPNIPLARVAKLSGFADSKAMGSTFLRLTGMIPTAYRRLQIPSPASASADKGAG